MKQQVAYVIQNKNDSQFLYLRNNLINWTEKIQNADFFENLNEVRGLLYFIQRKKKEREDEVNFQDLPFEFYNLNINNLNDIDLKELEIIECAITMPF